MHAAPGPASASKALSSPRLRELRHSRAAPAPVGTLPQALCCPLLAWLCCSFCGLAGTHRLLQWALAGRSLHWADARQGPRKWQPAHRRLHGQHLVTRLILAAAKRQSAGATGGVVCTWNPLPVLLALLHALEASLPLVTLQILKSVGRGRHTPGSGAAISQLAAWGPDRGGVDAATPQQPSTDGTAG